MEKGPEDLHDAWKRVEDLTVPHRERGVSGNMVGWLFSHEK